VTNPSWESTCAASTTSRGCVDTAITIPPALPEPVRHP
jgi:hypothetical protein